MVSSDLSPKLTNPFELPGKWYRGNLHTHTTESDGSRSPVEVLAWHADHQYDFVAITDHDLITTVAIHPPRPHAGADNGRLLVLPAAEISLGQTRQGSLLHAVAVGLPVTRLPANFVSPEAGLKWAWSAGAFAFVAHPHWSGFSTDELAGLGEVKALEVFNVASEREIHKGYASVYWDDLLGRGMPVLGVATDDSHWTGVDYGGGWVMVKATRLTAPTILHALRAGQFYSTSGPTIQDIRIDDNHLSVRTSPATAIYWVGAGSLGWNAHAEDGQTLVKADFELEGDPDWIRVEVCDARGRWAWSNPLFRR
jgi:hypothetical protein